jgi:hypothetical protein
VHLGAEEAEPAISGKRRYSGEKEEEEQDIQEMPMNFGFEVLVQRFQQSVLRLLVGSSATLRPKTDYATYGGEGLGMGDCRSRRYCRSTAGGGTGQLLARGDVLGAHGGIEGAVQC